MNALDKAFIRAYAKGLQGGGAAAVLDQAQDEPRAERAAAASQNRAALEVARLSPLVEVSAADGVWYRIEQAPSGLGSGGPAPHFAPQDYRAGRIPADAVRAAVESNLSAAEMLDSFLGLPPSMSPPARSESPSPMTRVDASHAPANAPASPSRQPAAPAEVLSGGELSAFEPGAPVSVISETWDAHLAPGLNPQSLCQCWIATEVLASPVVVEETWTAPANKPSIREPKPQPAPMASLIPQLAAPASATTSAPGRSAEPAASVKKQQEPPKVASKPAATPSAAPATIIKPQPPKSFQAAWEVDRLNWPEECDKLARGDAFGPLARTLAETSRRGRKVVAITGTRRGEGRTTLALCLARRAAKEGLRVVLLDADFERPHLGRRIGIDMENGWDDVLTDGQPLSEAAVSSLEDQLTVLPLGRRAAAFVSAHTVTALQRASEAFDLVLVDMGPAPGDESSEPAVEGPSAAAALLVHDRRDVTEEEVSQALDRLHAAGIETLGIVETFA